MLNRNITLDILKLLLAFMVVGLHANFLMDKSELASFLTVNGVFRIAVPIFFLINGYYFCTVLRKATQMAWFKRVLLLYISWMVFYSFFWLKGLGPSFIELREIALVVFFGYGHLWYISGLFISAILLLRVSNLTFIPVCLIIGITFISATVLQYLNNYYIFEGAIINVILKSFLYISGFSFFTLGYVIKKFDLCNKITTRVVILLSLVSFFALLAESYFNYSEMGLRKGVDIYFSLIFVCPLIFLLFLKIKVQGENKYFAMYSSGIYLVHIFILAIFRKYSVFSETELTLLVILTSIVASYFLIQINKKLKFIL